MNLVNLHKFGDNSKYLKEERIYLGYDMDIISLTRITPTRLIFDVKKDGVNYKLYMEDTKRFIR